MLNCVLFTCYFENERLHIRILIYTAKMSHYIAKPSLINAENLIIPQRFAYIMSICICEDFMKARKPP